MEEQKKESNEIKMDLKSKIFFLIMAILIAGAVFAAYYRYIMQRDYIIKAQIDCDPEVDNCFVWHCDPESTVAGEACTGDEEMDVWYYQILSRNAKNIPDCDPSDENCTAYECPDGEIDCAMEYCSDENVPEGEECNDPEQYLLDNPSDEEIECEEGDEECLAEIESEGCQEGDEECLADEEIAECEPGDAECISEDDSADCNSETGECEEAEAEIECAPDDPACASEDSDIEQDDSVPVLPQAETEPIQILP